MMQKILITLLIFIFTASGNNFLRAAEMQVSLFERQQKIAQHFVALEAVILRMADLIALTNPQQAALLKRVHQESRQKLLVMRIENSTSAIQSHRLAEALSAQQQVIDDLVALLRLLESDDRQARRAALRAQWEERIRQLDDLIQRQRALRAQTARREEIAPLAAEQKTLHTRAEEILTQWTNDFNDSPQETQSVPHETNPILDPIPRAREAMQNAEKSLRNEDRTPAQESQGDALSQLQQTRSELEKKLNQLRSEEKLERLKWLVTRLNFMLTREKEVRAGIASWQNSPSENSPSDIPKTVGNFSLEKPAAHRGGDITEGEASSPTRLGYSRAQQIYSARLAAEQGLIIAEAHAAIFVLREDGSAPVITETLQQISYDMTVLRERFHRGQLDETTREAACEIIASLEEMIAAVGQIRQAQEDELRANTNQNGAESQHEQQTQLVKMIAELKIIHAMQKRIHERTKQCEQIRQTNDFDAVQLANKLEELARQQAAISRLLHTIQSGRNQ